MSTADRVLDAALGGFVERGFHGVAVPRIAERAGVGMGTIYRHFESKEGLVNAVFQRAKRRLGAHLLQDLPTGPPRRTFLALWERLASFAVADGDALAFLELHHHQPYLDDSSRAIELELVAGIASILERAIDLGAVKPLPPEVAISLAWGAFVGLFKTHRLGFVELSPEVVQTSGEACWDLLARSTGEDA